MASLAGGVALAPARVAEAQSADDLQRARDLFREGLSLEAAGNWTAALAKFQEVGRVKLTPQVRFHIARCHENLGRLNEALGEYRLAEYEASQQQLAELAEISTAREQLEGRVPTLVIKRGAGAEVARIQLDGVELGEARIGKRVSVDPGPHTIVARLPDDRVFQESVTLSERESKEVELIPPADLAAAAPAASSPSQASPAASTPADAGVRDSGGPGVLPWVIGGVGAASLISSGVFFVLRNGAESDLDDICRDDGVCPESARSTQDKGELYATLSPVMLGVGVVGIGVATVWLLSSGSDEGAPRATTAAVRVDVGAVRGGGALSVRGAF